MNYDYLFKILLIGNTGVGKSTLLIKYIDNIFLSSHVNTIGVDFKINNIRINDKNIKLHIWDTAGQERYRSIIKAYYNGAHGVLIIIDLCNKESIEQIDFWINEIKKHSSSNIIMYIIGNKADLEHKRVISYNDINNYAKLNKIKYFETSATNFDDIDNVFNCIATDLMNEYKNSYIIVNNDSNDLNKIKINKYYYCSL